MTFHFGENRHFLVGVDTLDTYTHVTGEMQKEAAQRMGSFIAQAV